MQPPTPYLVSKPPKWLWIVPVASVGFLALVPVITIAAKARSARTWLVAGALSAAWLAGFAMIGSNEDGTTSDVGGFLFLGTLITSVVFALVMGPKVEWPGKVVYGAPPPSPPHDPNAAAVASVEAGRRKRHEARELLQRDPMMARDLRIGRPDLERQYDDGGLIDVNSAPPEVMSHWLGLSPAESAQVVDARTQLGRFQHPDDLVNYANLDPATYDRVSDRIVLM
ncbi:Helix-hairpin-helix motif-containing protein [Nocardioides exalbidus]|uniref:Helix-hairpin-helix motif-containing protein n=1 Tax=Nocardioides exalbidus TaxID=402596 RepID=A0A1H4QUN6_9ACTN|nr:helix-hairpin-helix domain-containing protein [Nocardioides exalbidus]SEC23379.1 Helix-hairpin-helix motif-containing protein [Nocardioides exalbidus]